MDTEARERIAIVRQVSPHWSVAIPSAFEEMYVEEGEGYWHARDSERSVSLTSVVVHDEHGPVPAASLVEQIPPPEGNRVEILPKGLAGWAVETEADPSAVASRAVSGLLAVDGHLLLATVTGDDHDWVSRTWRSIRYLERGWPERPYCEGTP